MNEAKYPQEPWRTERRNIGGRRVTLVVRGYGSKARYMTGANGSPQHFSAADAHAAIAKATGSAA